ncbi:MAG: alpha/beta hydrolase [Oligoflexia bacterium]|nr:alpha/beta hydrolase [Oligoflexia bacterium]
MRLEQGYFRSSDGVKLYYSVEGPSNAPPLIFCYGLVCSKLQWKYQWEYFKKNYRVYYMDYRGHGQSDRPEKASTVTIHRLAKDVLEFMHERNIKRAPILGHSLGVNIVLDLYRMAPEKVLALVLANGTAKDPFETMFHHNFLQVLFPLIRFAHDLAPDVLSKFWKSQGENLINQEFIARAGFNIKYADRKDINEYLRRTSTVDLDIFLNLLNDFIAYDATHWIHEIKAPTLIISGKKDLITPPVNQKIMHKLIPNSKMLMIKEGSHCPQMEQIDLVNENLEKFFLSLLPTSKTRKPILRESSI